MISILLWFAALSSGSVLCAAIWKRRYEEILPITCSIIVIVLFLCGIAGSLFLGGILVCILGIAAYITAALWIIRNKDWITFAKNIFTPGFLAFIIIFACVCLFNFGRVAYNWDEFSHWADIVKVMTTLNDFGTNPESFSIFRSYPPGMSLFQYYALKLSEWTISVPFNEWQLYAAYQIFMFSFILPFIKELRFKKIFTLMVSLVIILLCPLLFFQDIYDSIYIDPFLGVLSGTGLAAVFLCKKRDIFYSLQISLTMAILVLAKDVGILLAGFLGIAYVLDYVHGYRTDNGKASGSFQYKRWICIPVSVIAVGLPKLLWSFHLKVTGTLASFSQPYDIKEVIGVILGRNTGWQRTVWINYYRELDERVVSLGNTGIVINYYALLFLLMGLIAVLCLFFEKKEDAYRWKGRMLLWCVGIQFTVYIVGLCITYITKFSEAEAIGYASFGRYINIVYLAVWIVCVVLYLQIMQEYTRSSYVVEIMAVFVMLIVSPLQRAMDFACGDYVYNSLAYRAAFQELGDEIAKIPETSHIFFISQGTGQYELLAARYIFRPHVLNLDGWSIGGPEGGGSMYMKPVTPEEWYKELLESYDYVALYRVNEYFMDNYTSIFLDKNDISEKALYRINRETGLLERCQ